MGRPRKTERFDEIEEVVDDRENLDAQRADFENEMLPEQSAWLGHIPQEDWPDGVAFRWISVEVTGAPDNRNWSLKTAAHWTPVRRGKYPKIDKRFPSIDMPGVGDKSGGAIVFGGLCLCERSIRFNHRDRAAQQKATQDAQRTIESYVEGGNSAFPRFNQSSQTQFERGVRPASFKE